MNNHQQQQQLFLSPYYSLFCSYFTMNCLIRLLVTSLIMHSSQSKSINFDQSPVSSSSSGSSSKETPKHSTSFFVIDVVGGSRNSAEDSLLPADNSADNFDSYSNNYELKTTVDHSQYKYPKQLFTNVRNLQQQQKRDYLREPSDTQPYPYPYDSYSNYATSDWLNITHSSDQSQSEDTPQKVDPSSSLFKQQSRDMFNRLQYNQETQLPKNPAPFFINPSYPVPGSYPPHMIPAGMANRDSITNSSDETSPFFNLLNDHETVLGKIKNIKSEVCSAKMFNHQINVAGCGSKSIKNRYCYGRCNSFYIPLDANVDGSSTENENRFMTCSSCKPSNSTMIQVRVKCSHLAPQKFVAVIIEKVKACKCYAEFSQYQK